MARPALPARIASLVAKLRGALPFLAPKLPGSGSAPEPFDSLEDGTTLPGEDFEPNAAVGIAAGIRGKGAKGAGAEGGGLERLKSFVDVVLGNRLAIGLIVAVLVLILALFVVAFMVSAPPKTAMPDLPSEGRDVAAGEALVRRLLLPPLPSLEPKVELEREQGRVYTKADSAPYRSDMGKVEITGLKARQDAAVEALYGAVP